MEVHQRKAEPWKVTLVDTGEDTKTGGRLKRSGAWLGADSLVWAPSADLPEIRSSGIGLLLTAMPGTTDAGGMHKQATRGTTVELVQVGDDPAYWIAGASHEVVITDAEGEVVRDSARVSANTLVWTEGDVTYRLESALDRDEAVDLASMLRRPA